MDKPIVVDMRKINKVYPNGVIANEGVDFQVAEGEIHALMGENGAGKSTLMKILFGMEQPSGGEIFIDGKAAKIVSPLKAIDLGIGMVHQHFMLVPSLTVTENVILGMEPLNKGFIHYKKARTAVMEASNRYQFNLDPDAKIKDLDVGKKQKLEILKSLYRGAKILILDEPTAVLTPQETKELFNQLTVLCQSGHTIIFISHKISEVKNICHRLSIMRSGRMVGVYQTADMTHEDISEAMIGRDVIRPLEKQSLNKKESVIEVKHLHVKNEDHWVLRDVSMNVHKGQILGIAGVEGNGQREFIDCLTGLKKAYEGSILLQGVSIENKSIKEIRNLKLAHIPEDRMKYGTALTESIEDNLISNRYDKKDYLQGPFLNKNKIEALGRKLVEAFHIKTDSPKAIVSMLSGGNMQKVVAAREMTGDFEILIADQPTRGIDVGAAAFIHRQLSNLRDAGKGILLISADMNEVLHLSDSLVVFYGGEICGYFDDASQVTEEELGLYMLGLKKMALSAILEVAK